MRSGEGMAVIFPSVIIAGMTEFVPDKGGEKIRCGDCEYTKWTKLTVEKIVDHLAGYKEDGTDVIGVYPLLPDGTCRFLEFDFDKF